MTAEIVECDDCGSLVELDIVDRAMVELACDCPKYHYALFEDNPPEGWLNE